MIETKIITIAVSDGEDINSRINHYQIFGWQTNVSSTRRVTMNTRSTVWGTEYTIELKRDNKMNNYSQLVLLESKHDNLVTELALLPKRATKKYKPIQFSKSLSPTVKLLIAIFFFPFGLLVYLIKPKPEIDEGPTDEEIERQFQLDQAKLERDRANLKMKIETVLMEARGLL